MICVIENMRMTSMTVKALIIVCLICAYGLLCTATEHIELHTRVITELTKAPRRGCPPGQVRAGGICRQVYQRNKIL
ncbi:hypothetical protein J437_LFUL001510 [Ladona fulva]|uniref:Uncharacterized protein n=1 Tax=Ladona fulva TaxID=123851 RepID=A0A8K0NXU7_LADFU|nr:hypothetical protein J437_LFUL001510 [Ladona fulva]